TRELIEELQPWQSIPVTLEAYAREGTAPSAGGAPASSAAAGGAVAAGAAAGAGTAAAASSAQSDTSATSDTSAPPAEETGDTEPAPAGPEPAESGTTDVAEDELESTALMGAVPDDDLPEEDTSTRPDPAAVATAGAAGAAGIAGAAALAATDQRTEDGSSP